MVGCRKRTPSRDIFEAINRKHYLESEVQSMLAANPKLVAERDSNGDSPLTAAAVHGLTGLVTTLLKLGSKVDEVGRYGSTALINACHSRHLATVNVLLAHGADPNIKNDDGEVALHQVIMWCPEEVVLMEALIKAGADVSIRDGKGRTLLQVCRERRTQYEVPNSSRSPSLTKRILEDYDCAEALLESELSKRHGTEQGAPDRR